MARLRSVLALVAVLLLLVACAEEPEVEEEDPITVSGGFGRTPVVAFDAPLPLTEAEHVELVAGEGRTLEPEGPVLLRLSAYDGNTGEAWPDHGAGEARIVLLTPQEVGEELYPLLAGTAEGSRLLITQPVSAEGQDRMLVLVVDLLHSSAQGEELEQSPQLPTVAEEDGRVVISLPDEEPPDSLEVRTVIRGEGRQVSPGQRLVLQYEAVTWPGGDIYDSTWADGQVPRSVDVSDTFAGLRDGLVDQTVGSRTMIVVPPALGTGSQTLVFAVDILAAADPD